MSMKTGVIPEQLALLPDLMGLTLYLIEIPFNIFVNKADPDQAALVRAA